MPRTATATNGHERGLPLAACEDRFQALERQLASVASAVSGVAAAVESVKDLKTGIDVLHGRVSNVKEELAALFRNGPVTAIATRLAVLEALREEDHESDAHEAERDRKAWPPWAWLLTGAVLGLGTRGLEILGKLLIEQLAR